MNGSSPIKHTYLANLKTIIIQSSISVSKLKQSKQALHLIRPSSHKHMMSQESEHVNRKKHPWTNTHGTSTTPTARTCTACNSVCILPLPTGVEGDKGTVVDMWDPLYPLSPIRCGVIPLLPSAGSGASGSKCVLAVIDSQLVLINSWRSRTSISCLKSEIRRQDYHDVLQEFSLPLPRLESVGHDDQ